MGKSTSVFKRFLAGAFTCALALGALIGCSDGAGSTVKQSESQEPQSVSIENNNHTWTFEKAPERVVALDYTIAEYLCALGLEDKVVRVAPADYAPDDIKAEYYDTIMAMPAFDPNQMNYGTVPTLEMVLSTDPDFVIGTSFSFYDTNCGAPESYINSGINLYATEGTCVEKPTMEHVYNDLMNLGMIFGVEDRAQSIVDNMKARETKIANALKGASETVPVFVNYFDMGDGTIYTIGSSSFESSLIEAAGGRNVFSDSIDKQVATVSAEQLADMEAAYVIINTNSEAIGGIDPIITWNSMKSDPLLANVPAIRNDKYLAIPSISVYPGIQSIDALETIAKTLHPEAF